jgi:phage terminase large subunit
MSYAKTTATRKIANLTKRIRIVQGGTSASKTVSILIYLIVLAQTDKTPKLTSIVSESFPHLRRGAMRDFLNIMKEHGYFKQREWDMTNNIYTFPNKSQIEFFSVDQSEKVRGARRDRLFINEANNISFSAFEELEVRTKDFIFLDYNPTTEFWAFTEIMQTDKRTDWEHLILTYKDNEALSKEIVDSIEQRINRKGWWQVYGLGQLGEVEGKIYNGWQIIDEIPHEARLERYGLDFGYTNDPTALVAIYYYNGGYILDEILFAKGMSNKQIADTIKEMPKALVVADSAEPKSIDEIKSFRYENGSINVMPTVKGKDSVNNGIQIVQEQQISVTKRSVNVINEYRNYLWMVDKNGKVLNEPEHTFSHSMDAIRYGLVSIVPNKRKTVTYQWYQAQGDAPINPAL